METFFIYKEKEGAYRWYSLDTLGRYGRLFIFGYGYKGGFEVLKKHIRKKYGLKRVIWKGE